MIINKNGNNVLSYVKIFDQTIMIIKMFWQKETAFFENGAYLTLIASANRKCKVSKYLLTAFFRLIFVVVGGQNTTKFKCKYFCSK
jgi:hypothetical protein